MVHHLFLLIWQVFWSINCGYLINLALQLFLILYKPFPGSYQTQLLSPHIQDCCFSLRFFHWVTKEAHIHLYRLTNISGFLMKRIHNLGWRNFWLCDSAVCAPRNYEKSDNYYSTFFPIYLAICRFSWKINLWSKLAARKEITLNHPRGRYMKFFCKFSKKVFY